MSQQPYVHIRLRRDTSSNWTLNNPILKSGEPGLETDTRKLKFGDGVTPWNNLSYSGIDLGDEVVLENIDDRVASLIKAGSNISITYNDSDNELIVSATGLQLSGDYATLVNGKIPASQLPSYVDDVLEFNNLASFPSSGEGDKIYVAKDSNKTYRWSGSAYVEISASPGSTDAVPEGSINKYYTDARASAAAPVQSVNGLTGAVIIDSSDTGDITFSGIKIIGSGENSGDGNGYGTMELVPDINLYNNDQYLIVDPTAPNHIHLRAGGDQDDSNAQLIIGGENTHIRIVDSENNVSIKTISGGNTQSFDLGNTNSVATDLVSFSDIPIGSTFTDDGVTYTITDKSFDSSVGFVYIYSVYPQIKPATAGGNFNGSYDFVLPISDKNWTFENTGNINIPGNIILNNGTTVAVGTYDNSTGGNGGISLNCVVGYELNWQGGRLKSTYNNGINTNPLYIDSPISAGSGNFTQLTVNNTNISLADHNHDDRYYTENETDNLLAAKQDSGNYATLVDGQIPSSQLPGYVDDVIEYSNFSSFPSVGEAGKIYFSLDTNKTYRWSGSTYVEIVASPGSTDSVPEGSVNKYYTDARASAAAPVQSVAGRTGTVILTKNDVGLNQVNNTSDIDKPISTATQNALNLKINSSEVNTDFIAGAGISLTYDNVNDSLTISSAVDSVAGKTGSVLLTKSDVGLNNVDNTSDLNKPISSATQAALNTKQASGNYATLVNGTIPASQLPSYVDDIVEYASFSVFPATGESGKIYLALNNNTTYRWSGSTYVAISSSPGTTDSVPEGSVNKYYTDARASAAAPVQSVAGRTGIVTLTKNDVGLDNVNNTRDADKPISTATQTALDGKANSSHTHDDRYYTETEIDTLLAGKLNTSITNLSGSRTVYVDGNRTDAYTADGTIFRPFKTIQAAHDYAITVTNGPPSTAWYTGQVVIRINSGNYAENLTVTRSNIHFVGAGGPKTRDVIISGRVTLNINENPGVTRDNNLVSFSNLIVLGNVNTTNTLFTAGGTASYLLFFAHMHLSNPSGFEGAASCKTFEVTNTSSAGIRIEVREMLLGQDYSSLVAMDFNNVSVADIDQLSATSLGTLMELKTSYAIIGNSRFETTGASGAVAVIRAISSFAGAPATLVFGNSILVNGNTNGDGIYIGAGAVVNVGQAAFNIGTALGTGFAVNGVTGATLISASNTFGVLPVSPFLTNNKVATAITNASLGTSLTRNNVPLDTRTPASHTHGNITNAGAIGSTANLPVITTTNGVLTTGAFGTTANTFCQGNDSRLSDARNPLATTSSTAHGNSGTARTLSGTAAVQTCSLSANCTFTMPSASPVASFTLVLTQTGSFTAAFTGVKWPGGAAPTITTGANKVDIIRFVSDGTSWYGQVALNY